MTFTTSPCLISNKVYLTKKINVALLAEFRCPGIFLRVNTAIIVSLPKARSVAHLLTNKFCSVLT